MIWIGRHGACKQVTRFETPVEDGAADFGDRTMFGVRLGNRVSLWAGGAMVDCACGNGVVVVKPVRGAKADVPCGATCHRATGDVCVCSCAGSNHGRDHG